MANKKIILEQGGKPVPVNSESEEFDFASARFGASKGKIAEIDANTLGFDRRLRAGAGVNPADLATKGQLDTAVGDASSAFGTAINDLETAMIAADAAIQAQVNSIYANVAKQEIVGPLAAPQTVFPLTQFTVNVNPAVIDVHVYVNDRRWFTGWTKTDVDEITFADALPIDAVVTFFKPGTSTGGAGAPLKVLDEGVETDPAVVEMDFVGAGVSVTQTAAGKVEVSIPGGIGGGGAAASDAWKVEHHTITAGEAVAKSFTMGSVPLAPTEVVVDVIHGGAQAYGIDFLITVDEFSWDGLGLDGSLAEGDIIRLQYFA